MDGLRVRTILWKTNATEADRARAWRCIRAAGGWPKDHFYAELLEINVWRVKYEGPMNNYIDWFGPGARPWYMDLAR